jgi:hypothetical protein
VKLVRTIFQLLVLFSLPQVLLSHENEKKSCPIADFSPQVVYPPNPHFLSRISALGDWVEFKDGSVWVLSNGFIARSWLGSDRLMVTQNDRWLSNYNYQIVNLDNGESIEANFFSLNRGDFTHYIKEVNLQTGTIKINDNTRWEVFTEDLDKIADWKSSDLIIFGINGGPKKSIYGELLINARLGDRVRARQQ